MCVRHIYSILPFFRCMSISITKLSLTPSLPLILPQMSITSLPISFWSVTHTCSMVPHLKRKLKRLYSPITGGVRRGYFLINLSSNLRHQGQKTRQMPSIISRGHRRMSCINGGDWSMAAEKDLGRIVTVRKKYICSI